MFFLISSLFTCLSKVCDTLSYHTSTLSSWVWTKSESYLAFTIQCHFVAYRPAASVREFISDRSGCLELECDCIKILLLKLGFEIYFRNLFCYICWNSLKDLISVAVTGLLKWLFYVPVSIRQTELKSSPWLVSPACDLLLKHNFLIQLLFLLLKWHGLICSGETAGCTPIGGYCHDEG